MDKGEVAQFDKPYILLQDVGGIFYQMVQNTGSANAANLLQIAEKVNSNMEFAHSLTPGGSL